MRNEVCRLAALIEDTEDYRGEDSDDIHQLSVSILIVFFKLCLSSLNAGDWLVQSL